MTFKTLQELTEYLDLFRNIRDGSATDEQYSSWRPLLVEKVTLPEFYTFDAPTPVYTLVIAEHPTEKLSAKIFDSEGIFVKEYFTGTEAYDHVTRELDGDVVFEGDVTLMDEGNTRVRGMVTENRRLLLSHTDEDKEHLALYQYLEWLFLAEKYYKNPEDFLLSYRFVKSHPAFWYRHNAESNYWTHDYTRMWMEISRKDDGELVYMFEGGSAVPPNRTEHYHDPRLDVWAPSFEDGYIQFAALVDKFFYIDGSERENVPYIKQDWEIEVERRIKDYDEEFGTEFGQEDTDSDDENPNS